MKYPQLVLAKGDEIVIALDSLVNIKDSAVTTPAVKTSGRFQRSAYSLDDRFNWIIGSEGGFPILIPTVKKDAPA